MANLPITSLPTAIALDGSEVVPIVQGGTTKRVSVAEISTYPSVVGFPQGCLPGGRLTVTSGVPIPEAPVSSATTIYLTPADTNVTQVWDGANWVFKTFEELPIVLDTANAANTAYDVYEYVDASTGLLAVGTGPGWVSQTSRGTGAGTTEIENFQGRLVNTNNIVLRNNSISSAVIPARQATLRGTIRMTLVAGATADSAQQRFVSNLYNSTPRSLIRQVTAAEWPGVGAAYSVMNADFGNLLEWVQCVGGRNMDLHACLYVYGASTTETVATGISIDTLATDVSLFKQGDTYIAGTVPTQLSAHYQGFGGSAGGHFALPLQYGTSAMTFYGDGGVNARGTKSGIFGTVLA